MFHSLYRLFKKLVKEYELKSENDMEIEVTQNATLPLPTETTMYSDELKFL